MMFKYSIVWIKYKFLLGSIDIPSLMLNIHFSLSDVIMQIVDARNPLLFRCEDLVSVLEFEELLCNNLTTFL